MEQQRYFIQISYKGTNYFGWQRQPARPTIQGLLDDALSTILQEKIETTGAGRTDTGVHARYFVAHFDSGNRDLENKSYFIQRINRYLPPDIAAIRIKAVGCDAHSRFDAISRTYEYLITTVKDPMLVDYALLYFKSLDIAKMNRASEYLTRFDDFTSFSKLHSNTKTNICSIYSANWKISGSIISFTIRADRFLRNMVRAIVGSMIDVGRGKITSEEFRDIIIAKDRQKAGKSARAEGLYLINIEYPEDIYN